MERILDKQRLLTGYLEYLLLSAFESHGTPVGEIITPSDPAERGSQLSIEFKGSLEVMYEEFTKFGIVVSSQPYLKITEISFAYHVCTPATVNTHPSNRSVTLLGLLYSQEFHSSLVVFYSFSVRIVILWIVLRYSEKVWLYTAKK